MKGGDIDKKIIENIAKTKVELTAEVNNIKTAINEDNSKLKADIDLKLKTL